MAKKKEANEEMQQEETTVECEQTEEIPEKNEWQDKYIRLMADFDNYKKRTTKEMQASYKNGLIAAVEELLPVVDNFDRAVAAMAEDSKDGEGVRMIAKQLYDVLEKLGVKPIEAVGQPFDPNIHNAVMHIEDDAFGENVVAEDFLKGYMCGDKVIRPSMVKVAN
ncbi:MAG: nucleotide exchange factor GrpE [Clostridia bacterium]|nr:nucleotide exchange factor GrpE [Clostridia bacterium]